MTDTQQPIGQVSEVRVDTPNFQQVRVPVAVRLLWLLAPCLILFASVWLKIGQEREVTVPGWNIKLPELCTMYSRLGIDCPGCGLTRSFIHMSAGRIADAWRLNPVGILGYIFVALQIPIAALPWIPKLRDSKLLVKVGWFNQWLFLALMISLAGQWLIRMLWRGLS